MIFSWKYLMMLVHRLRRKLARQEEYGVMGFHCMVGPTQILEKLEKYRSIR